MNSNQMAERAVKLRDGIKSAADEVISIAKTGTGLEVASRFVLGGALSAVRLFGTYAPFGTAMVAMSGSGMGGALALLGSMLGYLLLGGITWGFRYAATAFLIHAANIVFRKTILAEKNWFAPLNAAFMMTVTGFPYVLDAGLNIRIATMYAMEVVLSGGCAYFYKIALSPWKPHAMGNDMMRHTISVMILLITAAASLSNIRPIGGISVGRTAVITAVMVIAFRCGAATGCAAGLVSGLMMDARGGIGEMFSASYAVSALAAAALSRKSKLRMAVVYVSVNALSVVWLGTGEGIASLYEAFCASVFFMLIPEKAFERLPAMFSGNRSRNEGLCAARYVRERVLLLAEAFRSLYKSARLDTSDKPEDIMSAFEKLQEECCGGCALEISCWERDIDETQNSFRVAAAEIDSRGEATKESFPSRFKDKCLRIDEITDTLNDELKLLKYRRQYKSRLRENKSAAHRHYAEMADILERVADDMELGFKAGTVIEEALRRFLLSRGVDAETEIFSDVGGRLHIEISGEGLRHLYDDENMLEKLSQALGVRLCEKRVTGETKRMIFMEAEPLAVSVGVAAVRKQGESVSGDRGTYFKTDEGIFYVILSDGMGSGENAARESSETVKLLENFLKAGLEPDAALLLLNSSMQLGGVDEPHCAGIDVMSVNLFSGEIKLCKYGAAPTYIKIGDSVKRICGESVAAGAFNDIEGKPDIVSMHLDIGAMAIITSDGIDTADDMWLRTILADYNGKTEKDLAREVMQESIKRHGCNDDMTVLVVSLKARA